MEEKQQTANKTSSTMTGAASGATIGSVAGPVGSLVGGVMGAIIGGVSAERQNAKQQKAVDKANAMTILREDNAIARQKKQFLQAGLNPSASAEVNSPEPSEMQAPNFTNYGSSLGSQLSGAFSSAGNQFANLINAQQQREFQDNLARLNGALNLVQVGYKNTLDRYNLNNQFVQELSLSLREIETNTVASGKMSSAQLSQKKTQLNEQTRNVNTAFNTVSELFAKTGQSLTDYEKTLQRDDVGVNASVSLNPVKLILSGADLGVTANTSKAFENAKQHVKNSEMSAADKKAFNTACDTFLRNLSELETTVTNLNQSTNTETKTIQQTGFGSYVELLLRVEDLKSENDLLKEKLSPEYMFKAYQNIYNQNY